MQPKHVLQQAASSHQNHSFFIGVLVIVAVCAILGIIGFVQEKREKERAEAKKKAALPAAKTPANPRGSVTID